MALWILKAPGLLRTVSAVLLTTATVADQVLPELDLSHGLNKAAVIAAVVGIVRAFARKAKG